MRRSLLIALAVPLLAIVGLAVLLLPRPGTAAPALTGTVLPGAAAPGFTLRDQLGRMVSLHQFAGRPVILTFLESKCREQCPLVVDTIRDMVQQAERRGVHPAILAVSTAPEDDTAASVRQFSVAHGLLNRWHYLAGPRQALAPIWHAYYIYAAPPSAPAAVRDNHTSATYLIDGQGKERVLLGGDPDPGALLRDLLILSGRPISSVTSSVALPEVGHLAPGFAARDVAGRELALGSLRGKVVLINFWASWCHPCRQEMPQLAAWYRRLHSRGLVIVGIDKQEDGQQVHSFAASLHIPYPLVADASGAISSRYDLQGLPASYVVDRQGAISALYYGALNQSWFQANVRSLL